MSQYHVKWAGLLAVGCSIMIGCRTYEHEEHCEYCPTIPRGAIPQPAGSSNIAWQSTQADIAETDDFVIYRYEWRHDSAVLSPFGQRHLEQLAERVLHEPRTIIVEDTGDEELDRARQEAVFTKLTLCGTEMPIEQVLIGRSRAEGLPGEEAPRLERAFLRAGSRSGGFGSSSGGSGLGGGGFGSVSGGGIR